ncbi:MAG: metallophosphoesterase [Burkholderiales bacterium]
MAISYKHILDAFQPSREISDPERFSGRIQQIERGAELLLARDHGFIHGTRGIGKSSLARQLALIASGKTDLLTAIDSKLSSESFDYVTCFLTRDASIQNINQLLYRLLIDKSGLAQWNELLGLSEVGTYELNGGLNTKLVSDFWYRVEMCSSLATQGVAIFIDEFELIEDQQGFASLIKANPAKCTFFITGIGKTEKDLVRDHESIERQLDTGKLEVPDMSESELRLIVANAQTCISNEIVFDGPAIDRLVRIVKGQPYLLHLIGKHSLLLAFKEKKAIITVSELDVALQQIAANRADRALEDRYLKAIGNSAQREIVLRVFASSPNEVVHTSHAYAEAESLTVNNPSYWAADLQKESFGSELEKVAEQYYKMRDPLFRAYASATPARLSNSDIAKPTKRREVDEFSIIHISDLHFGPRHYFTNLDISSDELPLADRPSLGKYLVESLKDSSRTANFLAISGDVTQGGLTSEFEEAATSITEIATVLNSAGVENKQNIGIVPGNHDVNWSIQQADPKARYLGFTPYIRFRNVLGLKMDSQVEPERLYEIIDLRNQYNCVVVCFNSAVLENADDHRGYIGESQFKNAIEELNALCGAKRPIKIAIMHHHLSQVSSLETSLRQPDEVLRDAAYIKRELIEEGFHVVLHGHRHFPHEEMVDQDGSGKNKLLIVGCGSTGVANIERDSQALQYNRITFRILIPQDTLAVTVARVFFDPTRRRWLQSEDHKPKTFSFPLSSIDHHA